MASGFPAAIDSLSTAHADGTNEVIHAATVNDLADAANKIEAELGTLPKGTFATVKARLDAIEKPVLNLQTGTTYTLVLADASKIVSMNNASANTLSIPTDASVAFPTGTQITIRQAGAGQTTVVAVTPGTTSLNSRGAAFKIAGQYGYGVVTKIAANTWELSGDLTT